MDLSNNEIEALDNLGHLSKLEELWISGNKLSNFGELGKIRSCSKLNTVYFENNPWCENPRYVAIVREALPSLLQIDAAIIQWK